MEYIFAALLIGAIGYLIYTGRKKLDVNQDGKVNSADAVAAVEKVEAAVVEEVKVVEEKVKAVAKKTVAKAKTAVAKTAKKPAPAKKAPAKK
jgi:hypothetical protein